MGQQRELRGTTRGEEDLDGAAVGSGRRSEDGEKTAVMRKRNDGRGGANRRWELLVQPTTSANERMVRKKKAPSGTRMMSE